MRPLLRILARYGLLLLIAACATVPITGRTQLNLLSDQQVIAAATQEYFRFMSVVTQKNLLLSPSESPQAAQAVSLVRRVADRIVDASGLRYQYAWEVGVVKAREANAFVMPNGKIVVFTGLLPVAKTEAGLAAVIGHEVAHVVARHRAERLSQALLAQITLTAVDAALAARDSKHRPIIGAALGLGAQYGILLPFSREHESEADRIGLLYMAKAGYDPSEAIGLWERMEAAAGSGPWEFLSTHPSPATRRSQIREWLPEANLYYADRSRPLPANLTELYLAREEHARTSALAPIATRPTLPPGFWYSMKRSDSSRIAAYKFDRVETCAVGQCFVVNEEGGAVGVFTADYALVEVRQPNETWTRFSPPLRSTQWPMRVGESWSDTLTVTNSSGQTQQVRVKGDVVGYESVTVPAGSFMAFKVVISLGGRLFREGWYAPETKTFVRSVQHDARRGRILSELVDYQRNSDSPTTQRD